MIHFLILIAVLLGGALYFMSTEERTRFLQVVVRALHEARDAATLAVPQSDPFFDALRERTRRVIVTPSIILVSATVFVLMAFGPRTAHGQWWRPLATPFAYSGVVDLFVNAVCLLQLGLILERLVGRLAFTTVYIAAGVAAGMVNLTASPDSVTVGASGSLLGMYGLLFVTSIWGLIHRWSLTIPLNVAKRLAPFVAIFILYTVMTTGLWNGAALAALACGLVAGVVAAKDLSERMPPIRRISTAMAAVVAIVIVTAYAVTLLQRPLNQATDVGPEIQRVIAVESQTAHVYDHAIERFRKGRMTAAALADVIEQTIVPQLHAAAARLNALHDVPPEHQPFVQTAEEFLRLRDESWRLRAAALHKGDMPGLRRADSKEQASLETLHRGKVPPKAGG